LYTSPFGSLNMFYNYVFALSIFILAAFVIKDKIFKNNILAPILTEHRISINIG